MKFGEFEIDTHKLVLLERGTPVRLASFHVQVLIEFSLHPSEDLSVTHLAEAVWGRAGVTITPNSVHQAVTSVRKALKDDRKNPKFIKTLPHGTYRWIYASAIEPSATTLKSVVMAETDLIVVRSVTTAWDLEAAFAERGYQFKVFPMGWSDSVLTALDDGLVDLAVFNRARTEEYLALRSDSDVVIVTDCFASMNGENFYVLGQKSGRWQPGMAPEAFKDRLLASKATVAVPRDSDMLDNFLLVLDLSRSELERQDITVREVESADGLTQFSYDPHLLLIHGQNVRFQAHYRTRYHGHKYIEVINFSSADPLKQETLRYRSKNCIVSRRPFIRAISIDVLKRIFAQAHESFRVAWKDHARYKDLVRTLSAIPFRYGTRDPREAEFIVREIVARTYGFKEPQT